MIPARRVAFTAFVVFSGSEDSAWWRLFTKRGFRHVQLIVPADSGRSLFAGNGQSILINPMTWAVTVDIIPHGARDAGRIALQHGASQVLEWPVDLRFEREFIPRGLLTCVSLIKAILGIHAWWCVTPEQLSVWMLRNGAKELIEA